MTFHHRSRALTFIDRRVYGGGGVNPRVKGHREAGTSPRRCSAESSGVRVRARLAALDFVISEVRPSRAARSTS